MDGDNAEARATAHKARRADERHREGAGVGVVAKAALGTMWATSS